MANVWSTDYTIGARLGPNARVSTGDQFQRLIESAIANGDTVYLLNGTTIRCNVNLFLWGAGSIVGECPEGCVIELSGTLSPDYSAYFLNLGLASKGSKPVPWTGQLKNLTIRASSSAADYTQLVQLHCSVGARIDNVVFDIRAMGSRSGATITSSINGQWNPGPYYNIGGRLINTKHLIAAHSTVGPGGINLSNLDDWDVIENLVTNSGDDPLAIMQSRNVRVVGNRCTSVYGRLGVFSSQGCDVIGNRATRVIGADGKWRPGMALISAATDYSISSAPTEHCTVANNIAHMPNCDGATQCLLDISGARSTVVSGNVLRSENTTATSVLGVRVIPFYSRIALGRPSTDRTGVDQDGTFRPRNLTIVGNVCSGTRPGTIEEQAQLAADIVGPIEYRGNLADIKTLGTRSRVG